MSLLMDALRKAEQQKQRLSAQAGERAGDENFGLALEPISPLDDAATTTPLSATALSAHSPQRSDGLPELPTSLEALDEQFMAHAAQAAATSQQQARRSVPYPAPEDRPPPASAYPPPSASAPPAMTKAEPLLKKAAPNPPFPDEPTLAAARETARTVFDVKQPKPAGNNRKFAIALGVLTLLAAAGIGGYFWWQLQPQSSLVALVPSAPPPSAPPQPSPPPSAPAVTSPAAQSSAAQSPATQPPATQPPIAQPPMTPPPASPAAGAAPLPPATALTATNAVPPAPTFMPADADESNEAASPPLRRRAKTPAAAMAAPEHAPTSPVRRTTAAPKPDDTLQFAHAAYQRGDFALANTAWHQALTADPRNLDALRGLAVLAQQRQQWAEAAGYFQRALEVDPKDAIALAGILALRQPADPLQAESRLKSFLAEQPDSPYLNFALGNQLARQQRWPEAQQAYFKAYAADPGNADYAFNLAVSLDQLRQTPLAVRYYNEALRTAALRPAGAIGFSRENVQKRLADLQATTP